MKKLRADTRQDADLVVLALAVECTCERSEPRLAFGSIVAPVLDLGRGVPWLVA